MTDLDQVSKCILGLNVHEAESYASLYDFKLRKTRIDDIPLVVTRDHRLDRINIHIKDGVVVTAYVG